MSDKKREIAIKLLKDKNDELGRIPYKSDFDEVSRAKIKGKLGPWPRALEAAGLKDAVAKNKKRKKKASSVSDKRLTRGDGTQNE